MQALLSPLLSSQAALGGCQKQKPEEWTCTCSVSAIGSLLKLLPLFVLLQRLKVTFPFEAKCTNEHSLLLRKCVGSVRGKGRRGEWKERGDPFAQLVRSKVLKDIIKCLCMYICDFYPS